MTSAKGPVISINAVRASVVYDLRERELLVEVGAVGHAHACEDVIRVEAVIGCEEADRDHSVYRLPTASLREHAIEHGHERFEVGRRPALHQAEVQERDAAVVVEAVVARVRIAVEHAVAMH